MISSDKYESIESCKQENIKLLAKLKYLRINLNNTELDLQKLIKDIVTLQRERNLSHKKTSNILEMSQINYKLLFDEATDAIFLMHNDMFVECNSTTLKMFGCTNESQIIGQKPQLFSPKIQPDGQSSYEKAEAKIKLAYDDKSQCFEWVHSKLNGDLFDAEVSLNHFEFQEKSYLFAVVRDITERRKLAYYDFLTGLPNRRSFFEKMDCYLSQPRYNNDIGALLFLDFDKFKHINDTMGHNFADALLIEFSNIVRKYLRKSDFIARIGGDEFVVLFTCSNEGQGALIEQVNQVAAKLLAKFRKPFELLSGEVQATISIGVTIFNLDERSSIDELIQEADLAMYQAKNTGGNKVKFFHKQMKESFLNRLHIENELREGIKNDKVRVVYQPIFNRHKKISSVEALSRWFCNGQGEVNPELFISVAEDTGLIMSLGMNMLKKAVTDVMNLNKSLTRENKINLAVNISPIQLQQSDFVSQVESLFNLLSIPKNFLTFEITENIIIYDLDRTIEKLNYLKDLGINVSLDDFGTGYSSLNLAKRLPLDVLKIDKSYVMALSSNKPNVSMVEIFISIAKYLSLEVVAEGVETQNQYKILHDLGCGMFQGYLFSKPIGIDSLSKLLS